MRKKSAYFSSMATQRFPSTYVFIINLLVIICISPIMNL